MAKYVMALDAGTTSNRCILFNKKGEIVSFAQKEFTQYFPKPGWVEHDANEIWSNQLGVAVEAMQKAELRRRILPRSVLQIRGKPPLSGTKIQGNLSTTPSYGNAGGLLNTAIPLRKKD